MSTKEYIIRNHLISFKTGYDVNFIYDVKDIRGRKYDPTNKVWYCPINLINKDDIGNLILKYVITCSNNSDSDWDTYLHENIDLLLEQKIHRLEQKIQELKLPWVVRDYQFNGIIYSLFTKRCINGSDMGTGKTFMSIMSVETEDLFPCLVISPTSVKYYWERQWKFVNNNRSVSVLEDNKIDFKSDVLIFTYGSLGSKVEVEDKVKIDIKHKELLNIKFKSIICDESHNLKSSKTVRSKSVGKLSKNIDYRFFLTGTPILNRPSEIISQLNLLGQFNDVFSWNYFVDRYCGAYMTQFGLDYSGATNTLELNSILKKYCYYRVDKKEVLTDLPDRVETILSVDIDNMKEYRHAENDFIEYIRESLGNVKANSALLAEEIVKINSLSHLSAVGKISNIIEWVEDFLESSNEKIVLFGIHIDIIKELSKKFKCDYITGEVNQKKRQSIIDDFQVNDKRVLIMNILTGGFGIDGLQNVSSNMLIYELPWRPTDIEQVVARLERSGQKNSVGVYYMLGNNTIDVKIWDIILQKEKVTDSVNKGVELDNSNRYLHNLVSSYL